MRRFVRALIVLHRTFSRRSLRDRAHILARFLTCPFLRIAPLVPRDGTLLDVGAGHGLFARLAADAGASRVIAVEPDVRKVQPVEGVAFVAGFDDVIRGSFDAVSLIDVLYKIPLDQWDALLERLHERLRRGGILIVKEHDPTSRLKHRWNAFQESLAASAGLTLGQSFSYEAPDAFVDRLKRLGFEDVRSERIDAWYPHPHVLFTARR